MLELHAITLMIQYPDRAYIHVSTYPDEVFDNPVYRTVFAIYKKFMRSHAVVDAVSIHTELIASGVSENEANLWYAEYARNAAPFFNPIIFDQLYETYRMRSLRVFGYKIIDGYYRDIEDAKRDIVPIFYDDVEYSKFTTSLDDIDFESCNTTPYYTNVDVIDEHLGALFGGQLICIAGRPSMGKSTLALQIAKQLARQNIPTYLASLEATEKEIVYRLIASETGIPVYSMMANKLSYEQTKIVKDTYNVLKAQLASFKIIKRYDMDDILYIVKRDKHSKCALIIDYLQIMQGSKKRNRVEEIGDMTRSLKLFAMEYNIPVILLSQLNRNSDGSVPKLSDLRDSGTIEQDCDVVVFVHKDDKRSTKAQIIFAKARDAGVGFVEAYHNIEQYTFSLNDTTVLL